MIYCENIVNVTVFFFYSSPDFETTFFFPPFSAMSLPQLLQFFFPISAMALPQLVYHNFFFFFHSGHSTHTSYPGNRNWAKDFRYSYYRNSTFSFSPFFFFFLILFVEFRQWWYRNLLSFLTILNNFQQFL